MKKRLRIGDIFYIRLLAEYKSLYIDRTMKTTIPPGKFEKIDTRPDPIKLISRLRLLRLSYNPPTTKEQIEEDKRFWADLRDEYGHEMKHINRDILSKLRKS